MSLVQTKFELLETREELAVGSLEMRVEWIVLWDFQPSSFSLPCSISLAHVLPSSFQASHLFQVAFNHILIGLPPGAALPSFKALIMRTFLARHMRYGFFRCSVKWLNEYLACCSGELEGVSLEAR